MKAVWNGRLLAESEDTVYLEGNHYFPADSVDGELLRPTRVKSLCPWKGIASYYALEAGGERAGYAAWSYRRPLPWVRSIRGRIAFSDAVEVLP